MITCVPVLRKTIRIDEEYSPLVRHAYWDSHDQLWRQRSSGLPFINITSFHASKWGETREEMGGSGLDLSVFSQHTQNVEKPEGSGTDKGQE